MVRRREPRSIEDERAWFRRGVEAYLETCYRLRTRATASEFAESFGLAPATLTRAFKRLFSQTPLRFLRVQQLERAARLLRESSRTTDEIAVASGLGTRATLFRRFSQHFGMTPDEYRQNHPVWDRGPIKK